MTDSDLDELKAAKEKLTQSAQALFTKMYESMQQNQGAAGAGPEQGAAGNAGQSTGSTSSADDDVIDGDFREV